MCFFCFSSKCICLFICLDFFTGKQGKWENNGSVNQQAESSIDVNAHKEAPSQWDLIPSIRCVLTVWEHNVLEHLIIFQKDNVQVNVHCIQQQTPNVYPPMLFDTSHTCCPCTLLLYPTSTAEILGYKSALHTSPSSRSESISCFCPGDPESS